MCRVTVHLKKSIPPRLQTLLTRVFCSLCEQDRRAAHEAFNMAGLSPLEMFELVMTANLREPEYTLENLRAVHQALLLLLTSRPTPDDKLVSGIQDLARRVLLKQEISPAVFTFVLLLMSSQQEPEVQCPGTYTEEWERRLHQLSCFHTMHSCFRRLLTAAVGEGKEPAKTSRYCLADVFDNGRGLVAELVAKWLLRLGSSCRLFAVNLDSVLVADVEMERGEMNLVTSCADFFPRSMEPDVLLVHLAWEELQLWQANRDAVDRASSALVGLKTISCHSLR
jgi:hypothetical protein